jgi:rhomboid protease GluP
LDSPGPASLAGADTGEPLIQVIKQTHLSRAPAKGSLWVAGASVGTLLLASATLWLDLLGLGSELAATSDGLFDRHEYWRAVTAIAIHSDLLHLAANALPFGVFAYLLHGYYGFWIHPVSTCGLGSAVTVLTLVTYPKPTALLGASGVVYLMAAFWLTLYLLVERRISLAKRLLRAAGFVMIVLLPTTLEPLVSYRAHAVGFAVGTVFGALYFLCKKSSLRRSERVEWE